MNLITIFNQFPDQQFLHRSFGGDPLAGASLLPTM